MSFDRAALELAVGRHGTIWRVVVAETVGSTPREAGAAMLVWPGGQQGTIGGGALELDATLRARSGQTGLRRVPLGPSLGQCCGGSATVLTERWDADRLGGIEEDIVARPVDGLAAMPLSVTRLLAGVRAGRTPLVPTLIDGWMIEAVTPPVRDLWIWGAGHVGRALVEILSPLPGLSITWIDTGPERFPDEVPARVRSLVAVDPPKLARHAPGPAEHLILTYSHEIDLALCHALLSHGFGAAGLIGSETKRVRFTKMLRHLGHADAAISRIRCPIGQKSFGKHPHAIALGVAADLVSGGQRDAAMKDTG